MYMCLQLASCFMIPLTSFVGLTDALHNEVTKINTTAIRLVDRSATTPSMFPHAFIYEDGEDSVAKMFSRHTPGVDSSATMPDLSTSACR